MSRGSVRIRPADTGDVEPLARLLDATDSRPGWGTGRPLRPCDRNDMFIRLRQLIESENRTVLVAVDDLAGPRPLASSMGSATRPATRPATGSAPVGEDIAGILVAKLDDIGAVDSAPVLHVTHLLVAPKQRRHGVGRALLAAATALADERGLDRVLVTVATKSRETNRYLARLGFAPLVVHRMATTATLHRSLGLADDAERMAVVRRARLIRGQRNRVPVGAVGRGA